MKVTDSVLSSFRAYSDDEKAFMMQKYLRNQFSFLGLPSPKRVEIAKPFLKSFTYQTYSELSADIRFLWEQPEREFQYLAMDLMTQNIKKLEEKSIELLEHIIVTKSWWDTVDLIASKLVGGYFTKYPNQIENITQRWMQSGNIWLQRSCVLYQLKYKKMTDLKKLESFIEELKDSKEFFIRKAIGWILREYSKSDPIYVFNYVGKTVLSTLSKNEALKYITKHK